MQQQKKQNLLFQICKMGRFKKKGTGKGSKTGRPVNPNLQEYKEDPKEHCKKSPAKNWGKRFQ